MNLNKILKILWQQDSWHFSKICKQETTIQYVFVSHKFLLGNSNNNIIYITNDLGTFIYV